MTPRDSTTDDVPVVPPGEIEDRVYTHTSTSHHGSIVGLYRHCHDVVGRDAFPAHDEIATAISLANPDGTFTATLRIFEITDDDMHTRWFKFIITKHGVDDWSTVSRAEIDAVVDGLMAAPWHWHFPGPHERPVRRDLVVTAGSPVMTYDVAYRDTACECVRCVSSLDAWTPIVVEINMV